MNMETGDKTNERTMTDQQSEILSQLNDEQREAVAYCDGPSLVIAGAGSGKTRVLTYKIAYLLTLGLQPWNILALTFTNKAAREMKERVGKLVGHDAAQRLYMGTFHSIFSRILRSEAELLGYKPSFTIYDESDSRSLLKAVIKELGLDSNLYKPATVSSRISMAKNHLILPAQYANDVDALARDREQHLSSLVKVYETYQARLYQANAMDFDDLLVNTFILLRDHADVRAKYAELFRYILVDEYQDTNSVQVSIVRLLAENGNRVCVVGDDYQSIYSFRGANIDNILDFQKKFPDTRLFKLERNYRSTQLIVSAASSLMKHNRWQIPKEVYSKGDEGERIAYHPCYSDREEAAVVAKEIERIKRKDKCDYDAFAILYRTNAQSRSFEDELRKRNMPYVIYGGLSFYQRKEIKDILAYFRLIINPDDGEALRRVINYPARGIGNSTMQKILDSASAHEVSLWAVICNPVQYALNVSKGTLTKLLAFQSLIDGFVQSASQNNAFEVGRQIIKESGIYADLYGESDAEAMARQENLEEFLSAMQSFVEDGMEADGGMHVSLADYLQEVALVTDMDRKDDGEPKITLMTVHASKGLEFPTVFVVGLEENIFPSPMASSSKRGLEEERRLLYVAITRAERHCVITNAKNRFRFGTMQFDNPSRFIDDIDPRFLSEKEDAFSSSVGQRMPWDKDFEMEKPYGRGHTRGEESRWQGSRWQNSSPVATQFRAEPKPKITRSPRPEQAVESLSSDALRRLTAEGGNFRRLKSAMTSGGRDMPASFSTSDAAKPSAGGELREGVTVEHQRFGVGVIKAIEGTGENTKATVEFRNAGRKQLLLKFAKLKVLADE